MYVPLQVNRFDESVLLNVQYRYLKSCSGDFYSPESDPLHKIMQYRVYNSTQLCFWFPPDRNLSGENDLYWRCTSFEKAFRWGRPFNLLHDSIFYMIHRGGRLSVGALFEPLRVRCSFWVSWMPPKNGVIALWPNTRVVKCKYCVSQKRNEANNKNQWVNVLLTFIFKFTARSQ